MSATSQIDAETTIGGIYVESLVRTQLRLALRTALLLLGTVGSMPALFALFPGFAHATVAGIPLSWLLPGVAVYPWLLVLAWNYVRRAEANEARFGDLVEPAGRRPGTDEQLS